MDDARDTLRRVGPADFRVFPAQSAPAEPPAPARADGCGCGGAGFYKKAVPYSHPDFARLFPCACRTRDTLAERRARLLQRANLTPLRDKTFATFNQRLAGVGEAYRRSWAYAAAWPHRQWALYLGPTGAGKSHLSAAIANEIADRCDPLTTTVHVATVPDLLDDLRSCYDPEAPARFHEVFDWVRNVSLLVLNDLATEAATAWAYEKLYQLINHRSEHRLATIISTNRPLDGLDERIVSRILDADLLPDGPIDMSAASDHRRRNERAQRKEAR